MSQGGRASVILRHDTRADDLLRHGSGNKREVGHIGVICIGLGVEEGVVPEAASCLPECALGDEYISGGFPLIFGSASHLGKAGNVVGVPLLEVGELFSIVSSRGGGPGR